MPRIRKIANHPFRTKTRKAKYKARPICSLCGKTSHNLSIKGFCSCITIASDFITQERESNGKMVRYRIINPDLFLDLINRHRKAEGREEKTDPVVRARVEREKKVSRAIKQEFYASWEWKSLRYKTLLKYGARCMCCGAGKETSQICVDHIIPISKCWSKRLDATNLQVLCGECNRGKSNKDETDFREAATDKLQ
jgi:5-methylcytosine-specific restriction endonuclease McrA